jgi:hypothetical protein
MCLCEVGSRFSLEPLSLPNRVDGLAVLGKIEETHLWRTFFCARPSYKRDKKDSVYAMAFLYQKASITSRLYKIGPGILHFFQKEHQYSYRFRSS